MAACCRKLLRRRGAHAPRVPFPAPSLETSGDVFDGASNTTAVGGCAPYSKTGGRDAGANGTDWSRTPHSAFRIPHGQRTLFLNSVWDGQQGKSGGERARSPNASRGAEMPDGRASVWIAVALAPLFGIPVTCHLSRVTFPASVALAASGALPENVNYAVKSSFLLGFLESVPAVSAKLKAPVTADRKFEDVVKSAQDAAVLVLVY